MSSTPIATAARLLRENAEELKQAHTLAGLGEWPACEGEVKAIYDEHIAVATALDAMPASEQAAWHAGLDEGRAQKSCLVQIQEPAVNQQLTTEQEPVWGQSRFHGQPWMSCAAEHVTMVLADQRYAAEGYEARYLYAAPVLAAQPEGDYLEGVNIPNLREALIFLGRENGVGEGEVGAKLAQYVNSMVSSVLSKKATLREADKAAPAAVAVPDEREAFEKWAALHYQGAKLERSGAGYRYALANEWWPAWQARAALAATPAADAPAALTNPQPFGYVVTTPAGADLFYRHPADLTIHNDHRAETVYTLLAAQAAAPVVLPEPAVVATTKHESPEKGSVEFTWGGNALKEEGEHKLFTEQQMRAALLAGVSAPAAVTVDPASIERQIEEVMVKIGAWDIAWVEWQNAMSDGESQQHITEKQNKWLAAGRDLRDLLRTLLSGAPQAQADAQPVPTPCRSMFATQREYADAMEQHRKNWAELESERAQQAQADARDAIRELIAKHSAELEQNEYAYFELAYTRQTGWMAWITDHPRSMPPAEVVKPDRKVIASGQGDTPEAACSAAIAAAKGE